MRDTIDTYKAPLDIVNDLSAKIFNTILPGSGYHRRYWLAVLYAPIITITYVLVSFMVDEQHLISDNIFTFFMAVFSISFLLISENVIGNNIRDTFEYISNTFDMEKETLETKYLAKIFTKWRTIVGVVVALTATVFAFLFVLNFPLGGHQSPLIRFSGVPVMFILGFIFGEAGLGAIITVYIEYKLMHDLSVDMEIMNKSHHDGLKRVGNWGLQIAVLLSVVASAAFIALISNPFISELRIIFPFGLGKLDNEAALSLIYGVFLFIFVLVFVLFVTPIYAISSNVGEKKQEELATISKKYNRIHSKVISMLSKEELGDEVDADFSRIEALDIMEKRIRRVNSIPYDIKSVRRLLEAVAIPSLTYLLRNTDIVSFLGI